MKKYDFQKIEKKWQKQWKEEGIYEPDLKGRRSKKFYNLMMFPYPSAEGLHAGNMYAFTGSDIYGRMKRMQGYDVFEPIGLDGFGIHSENYAMKVGTHPAKQAKVSEKRFYKQLEMIGNGFSWREHVETYDPEYYRWTQWLFLEMWRSGLAYRKKQAVNWCPSCQTVLADEQVIAGKCERCSSIVEKRELEQWFFKITKYANRLLKNLEKIDWAEKVKIAQKNWIGKSEGAELDFSIISGEDKLSEVKVFTTRPDTIFGATYLVLAPENAILGSLMERVTNTREVANYISLAKKKTEEERIMEDKEKTGVELKGIQAINPATGKPIPIWIADYVLGNYGTGAIMAVPAHDERDHDFAEKFLLPIVKVVRPEVNNEIGGQESECWIGEGLVMNSGKWNDYTTAEAKKVMALEYGAEKVQYRLRDWLISRQRYWGPPIPMIFCPSCAEKRKGERKDMPGWYGEKDKNLPVTLPMVKDFRPKGTGASPLASIKSFYEIKCPSCRGRARRETDVSDTFLDSSWYYLGYLMAASKWKHGVGSVQFKNIVRKWLPVDMYIGGAEHSVLHLLYSRFVTMVLKDLKHIPFEEPFTHFRAHGLIVKNGAKMSKSKGNVVNPDEYVKKFGADVLRTYLMFLAPFEQGGDFRDEAILGVDRFLNNVRRYFEELPNHKVKTTSPKLKKLLHKTIKKVTEDIENLKYNTAISQMMILFNELTSAGGSGEFLSSKDAGSALKLVAPFAPYLAEEIWRTQFGSKSIHREAWPKFDKKLIKDDVFILVIQVNGKMRGSVEAPTGLLEEEAKSLALSEPRVRDAVEGRDVRRIIYVPGRLINIVV